MPRYKDEPPAVRVYTVCDESRSVSLSCPSNSLLLELFFFFFIFFQLSYQTDSKISLILFIDQKLRTIIKQQKGFTKTVISLIPYDAEYSKIGTVSVSYTHALLAILKLLCCTGMKLILIILA